MWHRVLLVVVALFFVRVASVRPVSPDKVLATPEEITSDALRDRVVVEIFYEALCPYCQRLLIRGLMQVWNNSEVRDRVDVYLYPYGNTLTTHVDRAREGYMYWHEEVRQQGHKYIFRCQHGEDECFGNMVQACTMQYSKDRNQSIHFVTCMARRSTQLQELSAYFCATELGVDLSTVRACAHGQEGNELMNTVGEYSGKLKSPAGPMRYSPWVVLNGRHNKQAEWDAYRGYDGHLLWEVCQLLKEPKPVICLTWSNYIVSPEKAGLRGRLLSDGKYMLMIIALLCGIAIFIKAFRIYRLRQSDEDSSAGEEVANKAKGRSPVAS